MLLRPFNKYPGTDYETFNWEWILDTVKTLKKLVSAWNDKLTDLFDNAGIYTVIYDLINEHPEWASELPFVTPELYGYESGDVSTYLQQALDNDAGKYVLLLKKTYDLGDTITMSDGQKMRGLNRSQLKWTGIENGTMIRVTSKHNNRASIKNALIKLEDAKTAIEINANSWGGCANVKNVRFEGGTNAVVDMKTNFNTSFTDCEFFTNGFIQIRPWDEDMADSDTLSNCNTFERCYYSGASDRTGKAVRLVNAYNTSFIDCAIEKTALAFEQDRTHTTRTYGCWFENVNALYQGGEVSYDRSNHYVNVPAFNLDHQDIDKWEDNGSTQFLRYFGNITEPYRDVYAANNEYIDRVITVYNKAADNYEPMYKLSTKEFTTKMPHNVRRIHAAYTNSMSVNLPEFFQYSNIAALYRITAFVYYDDASTHLARWETMQRDSTTFTNGNENTLMKSNWGTANNNTLNRSVTNGVFRIETSTDNFRYAYLFVETIPLGNRMNPTNT